jgi:hypothetical protein
MFARAYEQRSTTPAPSAPQSLQRTFTKSWTPASGEPQQSVAGSSAPAPSKSTTNRQLSSAEIADHRIKGLCFRCDEKFVPGHREECKRLFIIEVLIDDDTPPPPADGDPTISIHALTGIQPRTSKTMQVQMFVGTTLLNSGSTHNFIDVAAAEGTGIMFQGGAGLRVAVANDRLSSPGCCSDLAIDIGCEPFSITCYKVALDSFNMVLGVQWLKSLDPVLWDFQRRTMAFVRNGRRIIWTASESSTAPHILAATSVDVMEDLLLQFTCIFTEPIGLPPVHQHSHQIRLLPGTGAVAVRPYCYAYAQKELEHQCADMLRLGIIRLSESTFSAPVLLVRKHDGSWCFYVDYLALNDRNVKDKFPIPVVEELLDELQGVSFFTKLDLWSGYHQVLMHPNNFERTAFRTHQGLFEFLVMPFGLTNAPTTFQALMNEVLQPFLRQFVLVFFDDILIYSSAWSEHLRYVWLVFEKL